MVRRILVGICLLVLLAGCGGRPEPTLQVEVSQDGSDLVFRLKTTNFRIGQDGHAHLRLNGGEEAMIYMSTYRIPNLAPGTYTVEIELSDQKHRNLGVKQNLTVEVK